MIPAPTSILAELTHRCPLRCPYCSNPLELDRKSAELSTDEWKRVLGEAADLGIFHVHFSGGEPFLNYKLLLKAVEISETLKFPSTFVETNCFWCKSDAFTRERLRALKAKGLIGIMISVNPYYAEYVPFERTDDLSAPSRKDRGTCCILESVLVR